MAAPLQLRIPTQTLMEMIEKHPDVKMELEHVACEKVAEEFVRKLMGGRMEEFQDRVVEQTATLMKTTVKDLKSNKTVLNDKARQIVEDEVRIAARKYIAENIGDLKEMVLAELTPLLTKSLAPHLEQMQKDRETLFKDLKAWFENRSLELDAQVKTTARTEFVSVLREAKAALE